MEKLFVTKIGCNGKQLKKTNELIKTCRKNIRKKSLNNKTQKK